MKKGELKIQDPNEIRECVKCKERKVLTEFIKGRRNLYRYLCKACRSAGRRTGKISETRFKPRHDKGVRFQKGHIPWYKEKQLPHPSKGNVDLENENRFDSFKYKEWKRQVFELKGKKCGLCGSENRVCAHHIVPWGKNPELRFDVKNGMPICNVCHGKLEGFHKGIEPHNKRCLQNKTND